MQGTKDELLGTKDDEEHLTFPNRSGFEIRKIELKLNFYDSEVYLSSSMVVARALDDEFDNNGNQEK